MRTLALLVIALLVPGAARATYHNMLIREVYTGPDAQYVMLQMWDTDQNFVHNRSLVVYGATGTAVQTDTFVGDLGNGANQATILIGTASVQAAFGIAPDLVMPAAAMSAAGGKVCWEPPIDCVAWGNYSGSTTGVGTPVAPGGIAAFKAIRRDLAISAGPTTLDATDDTNVSSADFDVVDPQPRNNPGQSGVTTTTNPGGTTSTSTSLPGGSTTTTLPGGSTTTTSPGASTTTTTLGCPSGVAGALCVLDGVPPPTCAAETLPGKLPRTIAAAGGLLERAAAAAGTKRGTRLAKKAGRKLGAASRMTSKAGEKGKLTPDCAAALAAALDQARARALGDLPAS